MQTLLNPKVQEDYAFIRGLHREINIKLKRQGKNMISHRSEETDIKRRRQ